MCANTPLRLDQSESLVPSSNPPFSPSLTDVKISMIWECVKLSLCILGGIGAITAGVMIVPWTGALFTLLCIHLGVECFSSIRTIQKIASLPPKQIVEQADFPNDLQVLFSWEISDKLCSYVQTLPLNQILDVQQRLSRIGKPLNWKLFETQLTEERNFNPHDFWQYKTQYKRAMITGAIPPEEFCHFFTLAAENHLVDQPKLFRSFLENVADTYHDLQRLFPDGTPFDGTWKGFSLKRCKTEIHASILSNIDLSVKNTSSFIPWSFLETTHVITAQDVLYLTQIDTINRKHSSRLFSAQCGADCEAIRQEYAAEVQQVTRAEPTQLPQFSPQENWKQQLSTQPLTAGTFRQWSVNELLQYGSYQDRTALQEKFSDYITAFSTLILDCAIAYQAMGQDARSVVNMQVMRNVFLYKTQHYSYANMLSFVQDPAGQVLCGALSLFSEEQTNRLQTTQRENTDFSNTPFWPPHSVRLVIEKVCTGAQPNDNTVSESKMSTDWMSNF